MGTRGLRPSFVELTISGIASAGLNIRSTNNNRSLIVSNRVAFLTKEAYRISGEGCYWLKAALSNQQDLNHLLDAILTIELICPSNL
ncbi:hypothetical protein JBW_01128 [Pelosinus fermentans JBW45]|uniref:Uncharacterized protein n=2 Tax=Pelosinus TaxID=365348 RepID=I8TVF6_9FIRM|nr:hypothetical protein JBW_01128 [Pelosinus fermentans JBW45]